MSIRRRLREHGPPPLRLAALKHLSCSTEAQVLCSASVICPNLQTLVVQSRDMNNAPDLGTPERPYLFDLATCPLPDIKIVDDRLGRLHLHQLASGMHSMFQIKTAPNAIVANSLTIQDMVVLLEWAHDTMRPIEEGTGRFKKLVFDNVKTAHLYELVGDVLLNRAKERDLDAAWKPFKWFAEKTDIVKIRKDGVERVIEGMEWRSDVRRQESDFFNLEKVWKKQRL